MDWKQIIGGVIIGAIVGIAVTFSLSVKEKARLEIQVEHLKSQIDRLRERKIAQPEEKTLDQGVSGSLGETSEFRSPDGRYEAVKVGTGAGLHYQIKEIDTDRIVLTTHAQYDTPNDVKMGKFSQDSKEFAAAYHYGIKTGYYSWTWIGIWDIATGKLLRTENLPGWAPDIDLIFAGKGITP
ncbi:MAG: hypothetical protein JSW70_02170 [Syntrophobacterales bacterium]|nr:MAG: hypothetical protein JSW70_02170 [Syntrophobacterales bacterium]